MFSYKSLIVRALVLKSVNPQVSAHCMRKGRFSHVPLMNISFLKTLITKTFFSFPEFQWHLCFKSVMVCMWSKFISLLWVSVPILMPLLHLITAITCLCSPTVCFVKCVLAVCDSLDFHINFRISLSSSSNQTSQDFDKACTASIGQYIEN